MTNQYIANPPTPETTRQAMTIPAIAPPPRPPFLLSASISAIGSLSPLTSSVTTSTYLASNATFPFVASKV